MLCLICGKKVFFCIDSFGSILLVVMEWFLLIEWGGDFKVVVGRGRERDKMELWDWNVSSWVDRWSGGGVVLVWFCFVYFVVGICCNCICIWFWYFGFVFVEFLFFCFLLDCSYLEVVVLCIFIGFCRWYGVLKSCVWLKLWILRFLFGCVDF